MESGALVAVCKDPQQPQGIPRGMEIAKKFGLEILPPPGAWHANHKNLNAVADVFHAHKFQCSVLFV